MNATLDCPRPSASTWGVADLSDDDLMHFVRTQDDRGAFAELVARHRAAALRHARRRLGGDSHRAEDLVQEAFLRVYDKRQRYQPSARFCGYLQRILLNLCLSELRRQRARPAQALGVAELSLAAPSALADESWTRQRSGLPSALARLPKLHRRALQLRYAEDLSCHEIALRLDRTRPAVKSLLFRARESLRRALVEPSLSPSRRLRTSRRHAWPRSNEPSTLPSVCSKRPFGTLRLTNKDYS